MSDSRPKDNGPASPPEMRLPARQELLAECWNEIGVYGNSQCSSLKEHAHCRHCPVYSAAAARLLDRPLPAGYRTEWTAYFGTGMNLREPGNTSAILFRLGSEWLALPTQVVQEVAERRAIHSLPRRAEEPVVGLANVRGELLICISLGHLIGLRDAPSPKALRASHSRLLVANSDLNRFAFPVNELSGPHRFRPEELNRPPATVTGLRPSYSQSVVQWRGQSVGILDPGLLFANLHRSLG